MSLDTLQRLRRRGLFHPADIAVYAVLLALIAALFLAVALQPKEDFVGIEIIWREDCIFRYSFGGTYQITQGYEARVAVSESETRLIVTVYTPDQTGYNEVTIERSGKVFVSATDCSARQDCLHMQPVQDSTGVILCVPHELKICALGESQTPRPPEIG